MHLAQVCWQEREPLTLPTRWRQMGAILSTCKPTATRKLEWTCKQIWPKTQAGQKLRMSETEWPGIFLGIWVWLPHGPRAFSTQTGLKRHPDMRRGHFLRQQKAEVHFLVDSANGCMIKWLRRLPALVKHMHTLVGTPPSSTDAAFHCHCVPWCHMPKSYGHCYSARSRPATPSQLLQCWVKASHTIPIILCNLIMGWAELQSLHSDTCHTCGHRCPAVGISTRIPTPFAGLAILSPVVIELHCTVTAPNVSLNMVQYIFQQGGQWTID